MTSHVLLCLDIDVADVSVFDSTGTGMADVRLTEGSEYNRAHPQSLHLIVETSEWTSGGWGQW